MTLSPTILLTIALAPLFGAIVAGLFRNQIGRAGAHWVTILGVALSCVLSIDVLYQLVWGGAETFNQNLYTWFQVGDFSTHVGFLIDRLTAGSVVDFVDVYWGNTHFWAFNVADSAITIGAILVLLDMIGIGRRHASNPV